MEHEFPQPFAQQYGTLLTTMVVATTPEDERNYEVEGSR